jgi:hypothetical protein
MTVALIALIFSMAGNGMAAKSLISGKQIKDGTVTGKDIKNGSVTAADLGKNAVKSSNLSNGAVTTRALRSQSVTSDTIRDDDIHSIDVNDKGGIIGTVDVAPGSVSNVEIKDDSITVDDLGAGSVDSSALGVCGPDVPACAFYASAADALNAVATGVLNGAVLKDGTVTSEDLAHDEPFTIVNGENVSMNQVFGNCGIRVHVPFSSAETSTGNMWSVQQTDRLTAHVPGIYRVTVSGSWAANPNGAVRLLQPEKTWGNAPHTGESEVFDSVTTPPLAVGTTDQSLSSEIALDANDYVTLQAAACGTSGPVDVPLEKVRMSIVWLRDK